MADGSHSFNFPAPQRSRLRPDEIVVDLFAGGGGASQAIKEALGIDPALAYNHDEQAIGMHAANHPFTIHHREDVWHADPRVDVAGRPVGWLHFSSDCTHFSQAKGGQPRSRKIRALSWVGLKWIGQLMAGDRRDGTNTAPRIVSMENVWQILTWGPLVAKRCKATGRVVRMDGTVAARGERVPVEHQQLVPDKRHAGRTWRQFVSAMRAKGYQVDWRRIDASHFGAGTDRVRLFLVARRDGQPVRWPTATHIGPAAANRAQVAADSIDWDLLGKSIFNRPRPLRPNTIKRLLSGAVRGSWPQPYIAALEALRDGIEPKLNVTSEQAEEIAKRFGHRAGLVMATGSGGSARDVACRPVPTITTGGAGSPRPGCARPHFVRPVIVHRHNSAGGRGARSVDEPVPTILTGGAGNLAEPIIAPYYGSGSGTTGQPCSRALPTVTTKCRFGLAEPVIVSTCNSSAAGVRLASDPLRTITTAKGGDMGIGEPVLLEYRIDILYRMLVKRELFNAQGFPKHYIIDRTADGTPISTTAAIRMVGNSVSPPPFRAIIAANVDQVSVTEAA